MTNNEQQPHSVGDSTDLDYTDKGVLERLYIDEDLTIREMAERLPCGRTTVHRWLDNHSILEDREKPWRDEETLRSLYYDDGLTIDEIAVELDCGRVTIHRWMDNHGIERTRSRYRAGREHTDRDRLVELYVEQELSPAEVADELDVHYRTVLKWLHKYDIPTRPRWETRREDHAAFNARKDGYEYWVVSEDGDTVLMAVHRLVAVAEYGFDAVAGKHVHHKNGIRWDNRPENLEPLTPSEHLTHHANERREELREQINSMERDERGLLLPQGSDS